MTHTTKGIVLRTVKYGETSLIVTLLTSQFGVQTYLINGARTSAKKPAKALMFQPSAILELEVYHNPMKNMQRIRESSWSFVYENILSDVLKNSIASFMIELLYKTIHQPEKNTDLFDFCEDALIHLDKAPPEVAANFALYFSLQLPQFFGFKIQEPHTSLAEQELFLDLKEGIFCNNKPSHAEFMQGDAAKITAELLKVMQPEELKELKLNKNIRRELLGYYQIYFAIHIADFGQMKTMKVMQEVLS